MNDERFDELMRDAAETYHTPPQPDFEAMWRGIERQMDDGAGKDSLPVATPKHFLHITRYLAIAATLVVGIALGRASMMIGSRQASPARAQVVASAHPALDVPSESAPYDVETSKYLGQTAALLIALPSEVKAGRADEQFVGRAGELLSRTRLLLDSPAAGDPQMRALLEDLELVLAQVVRLQNDKSSRVELDLINRALEQRDVIPRLRTAVADISAN